PSGGLLTERELELATLLAGVAAARLGAHLLAAELERSDRRGDALLAAAAEGLTVVDSHGRLEGWNRPAARLLGLTDEARMQRAPSQPMPAISGWPALAVLAEPGADEVDDAVSLLPGGAARVRSRRLRGDVAEPAGVVLALHPLGEVAGGRV